MRKVLSAIAIAALMLCFATAGIAADGKIGAFKLKTMDGSEITNETIKGKKTLFVVFQTACGQCRGELADVNKNLEDLSKSATVYAVMVDVGVERAIQNYKEAGYKMPVIVDSDFVIGGMADVTSSPATIIVDAEGKITFTKVGYRPGDLKKVMDLLN